MISLTDCWRIRPTRRLTAHSSTGRTCPGIQTAPKIRPFRIKDARSPYPLSAEEQSFLFQELPDHLARMAIFKVNTGTREQEVCALKWSYEVEVPELDTSVSFPASG